MIFTSFIILLGVLICVFIWRATKGAPRNIDSLEAAIYDLLRRGYDKGFLLIQISDSGKFIQVRKYIKGPGDYGIQLAFPNAEWSQIYFDAAKEYCVKSGFNGYVAYDGLLEFLYVDFGTNVENANRCIKGVLKEVLGVTPQTELFVRLENASVEDRLIDTPMS